ncbi:MAG: hypothetical protein AB7P04_04900 [Bacteriovoracia bacterium]
MKTISIALAGALFFTLPYLGRANDETRSVPIQSLNGRSPRVGGLPVEYELKPVARATIALIPTLRAEELIAPRDPQLPELPATRWFSSEQHARWYLHSLPTEVRASYRIENAPTWNGPNERGLLLPGVGTYDQGQLIHLNCFASQRKEIEIALIRYPEIRESISRTEEGRFVITLQDMRESAAAYVREVRSRNKVYPFDPGNTTDQTVATAPHISGDRYHPQARPIRLTAILNETGCQPVTAAQIGEWLQRIQTGTSTVDPLDSMIQLLSSPPPEPVSRTPRQDWVREAAINQAASKPDPSAEPAPAPSNAAPEPDAVRGRPAR